MNSKITVLLTALFFAGLAHAVPVLINYQGTYLDNAGVPVTQASAPVIISIWDNATSTNTVNRKYQENHTVAINDGNFSLRIGNGGTPVGTFDAALFDTTSNLYLQLNINGEAMLPRVRFLSAPYTLQSENSGKLGNQPITYFASAADLTALQNSLTAETSSRTTDVDTEESARMTDVSDEESARIAADNALQTQINNESSTRSGADTTLQTNINTANSTRASADSTLQTNINSEAAARAVADSATLETLCRATYGSVWLDSLALCVGGSVDLSNLDLTGQAMGGTRLSGANFTNTNLTNAGFVSSYINNVTFSSTTNVTGTNLFNATLTNVNLSTINLSLTTAGKLMYLYTDGLSACPIALPANWYCKTARTSPTTVYRLVGPYARFAIDRDVPDAVWDGTIFPTNLTGVNFKNNLFRNSAFSNGTNFTNANLYGVIFRYTDVGTGITWNNTTCPDGSNSSDTQNSGTCIGHGIPTQINLPPPG